MRRLTEREKWLKTVLLGYYKKHGCEGKRDSFVYTHKFDGIYADYIVYTKSKETKNEAWLSLVAVLKKGKENIPKHLGW